MLRTRMTLREEKPLRIPAPSFSFPVPMTTRGVNTRIPWLKVTTVLKKKKKRKKKRALRLPMHMRSSVTRNAPTALSFLAR